MTYDLLLNNIKADISRWHSNPFLSFIQRIESIQINIHPRIMFLFQALPVKTIQSNLLSGIKLSPGSCGRGKNRECDLGHRNSPKKKVEWLSNILFLLNPNQASTKFMYSGLQSKMEGHRKDLS